MRTQFSKILVALALLVGALLLSGATPAEARTFTNADIRQQVAVINQALMPAGDKLHAQEQLLGQYFGLVRARAIAAGVDPTTLPAQWRSFNYNDARDKFRFFRTAEDWQAYAVNVKACAGILAQAVHLSPEVAAVVQLELHRAGKDAHKAGRAHDQWKLFRQRLATDERLRIATLFSFERGYVAFGQDPAIPLPCHTAAQAQQSSIPSAPLEMAKQPEPEHGLQLVARRPGFVQWRMPNGVIVTNSVQIAFATVPAVGR